MQQEEARILPFPQMPQPAVHVTLWEGRRRPSEPLLRETLAGQGYQAVRWASAPFQVYVPHAHIYAELLWVTAGSVTVVLPAGRRLIELLPGDRIEVPAGMVHGSQAGADGATYLVATK